MNVKERLADTSVNPGFSSCWICPGCQANVEIVTSGFGNCPNCERKLKLDLVGQPIPVQQIIITQPVCVATICEGEAP